jgi:asparagine synthase (glutamine-hydrolysing)
MCGISGWLSSRGMVEETILTAMRERLAHRGPDGAATWVSSDRRVGLAHRRLSIIDLSEAAAQPMHVPGRASLVFNGEIYNHAELRDELELEGQHFDTDHSDTEVLLRGYLAWGLESLLERLVGMFAFALYDHREECVHLVRDRVGIKPFYFKRIANDLVFASETKALFAHPAIEASLDRESFCHFLSFRAVPAPRTLFDGVECLAAGERIEFDLTTSRVSRQRYWDPIAKVEAPPDTVEDARNRLSELLERSMDHRLVSDVPVGLFLSGGVDSAYLLQLMSRRRQGVHTFTVTYPGQDAYDEGGEARRLAEAAGCQHTEVPINEESYAAAQANVAWYQDEPIAAPVCTSVHFLSRAARQHDVPVILTGEGADELFIGYSNWLRLRDAERWNQRLPDFPGRPLRRSAAALGRTVMPWLSPHAEILRRAAAGQPLFWGGSTDFGEKAKQSLLGPAMRSEVPDPYEAVIAPLRRDFLDHGDEDDITGWMSYVDLRFRLPQLMLPRVDKMGMAASVEGRVPFLDHRVIEFVGGLPPAWRGATDPIGKAMFKTIASRELGNEFVYRKKRGFQAPVKEWKSGSFGRRYLPALEAFSARTELFDPSALTALLHQPNDRLYFSLTNFMLWYLIYIEDVLDGRLPEVKDTRSTCPRPEQEEVHAA